MNLPVLVRGISSTKTMASGNHHLANLGSRKARSSSGLTSAPSRSTTAASGRSAHLGWGTAITAASATAGWLISAFSRSCELIHSPPDLMRSLVRSVILT